METIFYNAQQLEKQQLVTTEFRLILFSTPQRSFPPRLFLLKNKNAMENG